MAYFNQKATVKTPKYSVFNLTYESIGTLRMAMAYPIVHKEILPGDHFSLNIDHIMRLAPLQSPVFDDVELHFRAFFTPNRILDPRWKEFITGGVGLYGSSDNEIQPLSFKLPALAFALPRGQRATDSKYGLENGALADWLNFHVGGIADSDDLTNPDSTPIDFGAPYLINENDSFASASWLIDHSGNTSDLDFVLDSTPYNILPFLGYHKIYDDWYRNERVQEEHLPLFYEALGNSRVIDYVGSDPVSWNSWTKSVAPIFNLFRVNYGKDRYTTGLPEPNVGGEINIINDPESFEVEGTKFSAAPVMFNLSGAPYGSVITTHVGEGIPPTSGAPSLSSMYGTAEEPYASPSPFLALIQSAQATIQQLKTQFKMYSFFMKDTYNGNRYVEFMDSHFDVRVPDATLDRAIYLGQLKVRISFGEVFQTSNGDGSSDQGVLGDYAGRGASYSDGGYLVNDRFLEHGQLYVIASIVPRAKYYQGIDRKFIKSDRFSFFFPEFQDIGDDQLFTKELFYRGDGASTDTDVFAYNARWTDLKESLDEVHGDFRGNMDHYHFARVFSDAPRLGSDFSEAPSNNRPFSIIDTFSENYLLNARFNIQASRPMMMFESF